MEEKRTSGLSVAVVLMLLPVLLYVGSYLALVVPYGDFAFYRFGGRTSARLFWPLEQIDRKVRVEAWKQPPPLLIPASSPSSP